jgi:hypothetical protein
MLMLTASNYVNMTRMALGSSSSHWRSATRGADVVVEAGDSETAQALLGRTVDEPVKPQWAFGNLPALSVPNSIDPTIIRSIARTRRS